MEEIRLISTPSPSSSTLLKPVCSSLAAPSIDKKKRTDSPSIIQLSDVTSSKPSLLPDEALGSLLFEALDGFFFTINHNSELDFVSDNVEQYLKFSQEELAGRNLHHCIHPNDVDEFNKAWEKKDAGDSLTSTVNNEQRIGQSRGCTFPCRMRTSDESSPYITMIVSAAVRRDSSGHDKTFLVCFARRLQLHELQDRSAVLGFDQFSSRINLEYDIESLDSSHMKNERLDMNFVGKNFRDYVYASDIPLINRHFQEVVEKGESKSAIYRFCLHDDIYAFVNTQSKLFSNVTTSKSESIVSTHTIIRLMKNTNDLNSNASTRLIKSIINSNRDLQAHAHQSSGNKIIAPSPSTTVPASSTSTPPIGTQFALTMLGMHKNASDSLQQHISSTLGTLVQVQNSLSVPINSPIDKNQQQQQTLPSPSRTNTQISSTFDAASSLNEVEFGSKRTSLSTSFSSVHSNHENVSSPMDSLDFLFTPVSPSNDINSFLSSCSPTDKTSSSSSPLLLIDPMPLLLPNNDICTAASSLITTPNNHSRNSARLRQLLSTRSPSSTTAILNPHFPNEDKSHSNTFDDCIQVAESPTTTHISPLSNGLSSPIKRQDNHSPTNKTTTNTNCSTDILKQLLERQPPITTVSSTVNVSDKSTLENNSTWSSSSSLPEIKVQSDTCNDNPAGKQTAVTTKPVRSDTYLRTLLNDNICLQKVIVKAPFSSQSRHKLSQHESGGIHGLVVNDNETESIVNYANSSLESQLATSANHSSDLSIQNRKSKKKQRQHSYSLDSRMKSTTQTKKPGRPKRNLSQYSILNSQSTVSDRSPDSLHDSAKSLEQSSINRLFTNPPEHAEPQLSASNRRKNRKRLIDNDDQLQKSKKYPKLFSCTFENNVKTEHQGHSIITTSAAIAATRPLNQNSSTKIKIEPDTFDHALSLGKTPMSLFKRSSNNSTSSNLQSPLLRTLISTSQSSSITTKNDEPLYCLLQNHDKSNSSIFSTINSSSSSTITNNSNNINANDNNNTNNNNSIDLFEQYLTPALPKSTLTATNLVAKDDYLAALLSSDPQLPNEISFTPVSKQQASTLNRSTSTLNDNSRITAIANELYNSTTTAADVPIVNSSTDELLSILDNKDFLECLNESTAIDSILSQNSTNIMDTSAQSTTPKHTEQDKKAISEIYKTLVTSINPGSVTGDFLLVENNAMPMPPNGTVESDPSTAIYRQQSTTYPYQTSQQQSLSKNSSQYSDCLSMDLIENNAFPPNKSLSPIANCYAQSRSITPTHAETSARIMYAQQTLPNMQHHQGQNPVPNLFYHQTSQLPQKAIYNNYASNQIVPGYYPIQQQRQHMLSTNHLSQLNQRNTLTPQLRAAQQHNNQQLQLHMPMNATLPQMASNQQQQSQQQHRPMFNTQSDLMMSNGNSLSLQHDLNPLSPSLLNNNSLDLSYGHELFMSPSSSGSTQQHQQITPNIHMNGIQPQQQPTITVPQVAAQQPYPNMSTALSATLQQNSHNSNNNLTNSSAPNNLTPAECRQSEELNNQIMNCLSFQASRSTNESVRKQLQNTIRGRQRLAGGKDMLETTGQTLINSSNLDSNQKGAYFRRQLSSQKSTPPLSTNVRSQHHQQ